MNEDIKKTVTMLTNLLKLSKLNFKVEESTITLNQKDLESAVKLLRKIGFEGYDDDPEITEFFLSKGKALISIDIRSMIVLLGINGDTSGKLIVPDSIHLSNCEYLTALPENLQVGGYLNLYGCFNLKALPKNLKVGKGLYLTRCTSLTSLPENLEISGSLILSGCTSLTSLPENLEISGSLDLEECTSLTSLPENLAVGKYLGLRGCTNLKSIPESTKTKRIYISAGSKIKIPSNLQDITSEV
jgi:hypothetical protein